MNLVTVVSSHLFHSEKTAGKVSYTPDWTTIQQSCKSGYKVVQENGKVLNKDAVVHQEMPALPDRVMCLEKIAWHENYKQNKNKLNNKLKISCTKCRDRVCHLT